MGPPCSSQCQTDLDALERTCFRFGVPLAAHKQVGPTTKLTFPGIEIDTVAGVIRLPEDKLQCLVSILTEWDDRKVCSRRELELLVGLLNHACKVVHPGHSFLQRKIDLLTITGHSASSKPFHHIRLNREFRVDLAWWRTFIIPWNGVGLLKGSVTTREFEFSSDTSGSWDCGACFGTSWFQYA